LQESEVRRKTFHREDAKGAKLGKLRLRFLRAFGAFAVKGICSSFMAVGSSWHIQAYAVNGIGLFRSYNSLMRKPIAAFLTLFVAVMAHADPLVAPPQVIPTEIQSREKVDALIAHAPNHRATVGILHAAMMISIDFGAPAWNSGDHEACCRFYVKTGQSLCDAFADANNASAGARIALDELKGALARVQTSADPDANA